MALRVTKIGEIAGGYVIWVRGGALRGGDLAARLTNLAPTKSKKPGPRWKMLLVIGKGEAAREIDIDLEPFLSDSEYRRSYEEPIFVDAASTDSPHLHSLVLFRNRLFAPHRKLLSPMEQQELVLRAKELAYREDNELTSIQAYVANVEAATEFQRIGPKRDPIADDVRLLVWTRDGGACVRCGSKEKLHFDHIIPVAKGGSSEALNIQLLCQSCNLQKSDKIAF